MSNSNIKEIPNLGIVKKQENKIKHLDYYSFEDRTFDLIKLLNSSIDLDYSKIINAKTYKDVAKHYKSTEPRKNHTIFNGVYKLAPIKDFIGNIPEENQIEISLKFQSLLDNPFLKQDFEIVILAPLNNFASENNIKAIDPIAFAYFKEGENCYEHNYLITLSQWI